MKTQLCLFFITIFCLSHLVKGSKVDLVALGECGKLHRTEFHNITNPWAVYSNSKCVLKCSLGEKILTYDAINEGLPCPEYPSGVSLIYSYPFGIVQTTWQHVCTISEKR